MWLAAPAGDLHAASYCCTLPDAESKLIARCTVLVLPNAASAARATLISSSAFCHTTGHNISNVLASGAVPWNTGSRVTVECASTRIGIRPGRASHSSLIDSSAESHVSRNRSIS